MPYGVDKKLGGDSKENTNWMEKCVNSVGGKNSRTGKPYTKGEKIAICKSQMKKKHAKSALTELVEVDASVTRDVENTIFSFAERLYKFNKAATLTDAYYLTQVYLERCNHDIDILKMVAIK